MGRGTGRGATEGWEKPRAHENASCGEALLPGGVKLGGVRAWGLTRVGGSKAILVAAALGEDST